MRIIAGPCQHESYEHSKMIAEECAAVCKKYGIEYYFKASYDKANRTSISSKRGIGLRNTMKDFDRLKSEIPGLKIVTDVHDVEQVYLIADEYSRCVDVLQIPAFLCRQTDLVVAAASTQKIVNIKKGQFVAPWDVEFILDKAKDAKDVWITERGTSFGYNRLVVDFTGLDYMLTNYPNVVFDVTHSVQEPGVGGNRSYVPGLARAASAMGVKNFFFEVHDDPPNAPSDGDNMIFLEDFEEVVDMIVGCHYVNSDYYPS